MAKIIVYNEATNQLLTFTRAENGPMPFSSARTLLVKEFRGSSGSSTLWTTNRAMEAWNATRARWNNPIHVGFAFKRIWEGGHGTTSQHYAGVSFDVGENLSSAMRLSLRNLAINLGVWGYVEPASMTPTWVHFDRRYGNPSCGGTAGYPTVRRGSKSTYVLVLQDALNALGYSTGSLDGAFGPNTEAALKRYQRAKGLTADGVCGCNTWTKIATQANGIGRTSTVID